MSASPVLVAALAAVLAAAVLALTTTTARLGRTRHKLATVWQQAGTDPLTGLANRHPYRSPRRRAA
jgi:GGDEF domain-containing protein